MVDGRLPRRGEAEGASMKHMMRALNTKRKDGVLFAWMMARASYEYSRSHGLTRRQSVSGAWELFWEKL